MASVFDGTTEFKLWRTRVENELLRFHLLGYIFVKDYDGSQGFHYNNEAIPPKCGDAQAHIVLKSEPKHYEMNKTNIKHLVNSQTGGLSRLEVIAERAEAMSILQRYLHPEVERAILGKNIYDSWQTLCEIYENRSGTNIYLMHRMLHMMQLGEKKNESALEFITRMEIMMSEYAKVTGMELTDPYRSTVLVNSLPETWEPLINIWKAFKPYIPYKELVEKVITEHTRIMNEEEEERRAADKEKKIVAILKPTKSSSFALKSTTSSTASSTSKSKDPLPAAAAATDLSLSVKDTTTSPSATSMPRATLTFSSSEQSKPTSSSTHERHKEKEKAMELRTTSSSWKKDKDSDVSSFENTPMCFYCLKKGHTLRKCWYLRNDIDADTTHRPNQKYSATVTKIRTQWMVDRIDEYIREQKMLLAPCSDKDTSSSTYSTKHNTTNSSSYNHPNIQSSNTFIDRRPSPRYDHSFSNSSCSRLPPSSNDQYEHSHHHSVNHEDGSRYRKRSRSMAFTAPEEPPAKIKPQDPRSPSMYRGSVPRQNSYPPPPRRSHTSSYKRHFGAAEREPSEYIINSNC